MLNEALTPRQQRGMMLAATAHIRRKSGMFEVPSASNAGQSYIVAKIAGHFHCTCPDFELTGQPCWARRTCKHAYAVEFFEKRETTPDGTVTETRGVRVSFERVRFDRLRRIAHQHVGKVGTRIVAMNQQPLAGARLRLSVARGVYRLSGDSVFNLHRDEFLASYHTRSNVESTFSAIKRKFGDQIRSKTPVAQTNEALLKVLCHNIVCLIHEMNESGAPVAFSRPLVDS